jgi:hypothetical protein
MLLAPEISQHWQNLADFAGISKAELIRRRMEGCRIKTIPQVNWKCYWQLLKINENIDKIAKAQNLAISQCLNPPQIDHITFEELKAEISRLRLHLLLGHNQTIRNS